MAYPYLWGGPRPVFGSGRPHPGQLPHFLMKTGSAIFAVKNLLLLTTRSNLHPATNSFEVVLGGSTRYWCNRDSPISAFWSLVWNHLFEEFSQDNTIQTSNIYIYTVYIYIYIYCIYTLHINNTVLHHHM